ncbi:hypothetical protein FPQ18DRAFT_389510 [Pyronema domesticum]|nr:hypothetical protein FPQ18DRAFT_389510 [Pyronema domesticum]
MSDINNQPNNIEKVLKGYLNAVEAQASKNEQEALRENLSSTERANTSLTQRTNYSSKPKASFSGLPSELLELIGESTTIGTLASLCRVDRLCQQIMPDTVYQKGAELSNTEKKFYKSPVFRSIKNSNFNALSGLYKNGFSNIDIVFNIPRGRFRKDVGAPWASLINFAIQQGDLKILRYVLRRHFSRKLPDPNLITRGVQPVLSTAIWQCKNPKITLHTIISMMQMLIEFKADVNAEDMNTRLTPLCIAIDRAETG